jgi:hypothetical protein
MTGIIYKKTSAESDESSSSPDNITDGDYQPGQLWTTVVKKADLQGVLSGRALLFSAKPPSPSTTQQDLHRLQKVHQYFQSMGKEDDRLTRLISQKLNWEAFERRYVEVVDRVLVKRPELVHRCRAYLAKYLQTGHPDEEKFMGLVEETLRQDQAAGANARALASSLFLSSLIMSMVLWLSL